MRPSTCLLLAALAAPLAASETAVLEEPYVDPIHAEIPFGLRSHYLVPWRAYLDTRSARSFLDFPAVGGLGKDPAGYDAVAQLLAEHGVVAVRLECGWSGIDWNDRMNEDTRRRARAELQACQRHGLRPLILLNAHHGVPGPNRGLRLQVTRDAPAGAREIHVADAHRLVPQRSGLSNVDDYKMAFPLVTAIDPASGRCTLSAPLPKAVSAGEHWFHELKYLPFSPPRWEDGRDNPESAATIDGWMRYVAEVCRVAREVVGDAEDAGFDLEVWNEYTFGSDFLDIQKYYDPDLPLADRIEYRKHGRRASGPEAILPMVVDHVQDPANRLPGVRVVSGFSNQRPWDSGVDAWPGQYALSKHYYSGLEPHRIGGDEQAFMGRDRGFASVGLDGSQLGIRRPGDWHTVEPGSYHIPAHLLRCPEFAFYGYKTEFITRDLQPFPSTASGPVSFAHHHRFAHPGTGVPPAWWQTEYNVFRQPWTDELIADGADATDPRFATLMHEVGAKALLRSAVMQQHKGVERIFYFATQHHDHGFAVVPDAFFEALEAADWQLDDALRAQGGPQLQALRRLVDVFAAGEALPHPRALRVERVVEHDPQLVLPGDGSAATPDRFHRHDLAVLPYQLAPGRFAVVVYVVTRNLVAVRDQDRDLLDPARYDLPPQRFELTLGNLVGRDARLSALDPLHDETVPVEHLAGDGRSLAFALPVTDSPRIVLIDEAQPAAQLLEASVRPVGSEAAQLTLRVDRTLTATVSWGPMPGRVPGGWSAQWFADREMTRPVLSRSEGPIDHRWSGSPAPGVPEDDFAVRWEGELTIPEAGSWRFATETDDGARLWIDDELLIDDWQTHGTERHEATRQLSAGSHRLRMDFFDSGGGAVARLLWAAPAGELAPIPLTAVRPLAGESLGGRTTLVLLAGDPAQLSIPRFPLTIPLPVGWGVRVEAKDAEIALRWPAWDHDVAGQARFAIPYPGDHDPSATGPDWPALAASAGPAPRAPADWRSVGSEHQADLPGDVHARWMQLASREAALALLPTTAATDQLTISSGSWNDRACWRVDFAADAAAHPGLQALVQRLAILPTAEGLTALLLAGADAEAVEAAAQRLDLR